MRANDATILTGPNGTGKTHLLKLIKAVLTFDAQSLIATQYELVRLIFEDNTGVLVQRYVDGPEDQDPFVEMIALVDRRPVGDSLRLDRRVAPRGLPDGIGLVAGQHFVDRQSGLRLPGSFVRSKYGVEPLLSKSDTTADHAALIAIADRPAPVLIETSRLDGIATASATNEEAAPSATARIDEYIENLRNEIIAAKRTSADVTQSADASFAERALAVAKETVNETELRDRYEETVKRFRALSDNALAVGEAPIEFPAVTTPTVRRIMRVFVDDWDRRLAPLLPVNARITALREILDEKLALSGKSTFITAEGTLEFRSRDLSKIALSQLSSGEKHLVALFSSLLFSGVQGSLVLIDEPEISLHAAWKHSFIADSARIAHLMDLQLILATHSTAIINGRWEITEELNFPSREARNA
ncbi:AAA family ATPase [Curtobacterium albidum]|uniref:AAA family ATPase n=1 Tax=Curtobacterium citreum TaxID=2036 RepID=A0A850DX16_9MICO|nr:AAA family ATPase [Curtobacterium albidum]